MIVELDTPRIIISAPHGKTGKTIVTLAIAYALRSRGLKVQLFKIGPDFIDPTYHNIVSETPSRNLDVVLHGVEKTLFRLAKYSRNVNIALIEGVFGLFDSPDGISELGSTAYISKLTRTPVVLVLSAERTNKTLVSIVKGLKSFDQEVKVRGVILTNVASESQYEKISRAFEQYLQGEVQLLGYIPRRSEIAKLFRYRHLGLVPVPEAKTRENLSKIFDEISSHLKVDALLRIASEAEPMRIIISSHYVERKDSEKKQLNIGIIYDSIFTFYYPETIERCLELTGNTYFIDSTRDQSLPPNLDILIIGGGFPEEHADLLSKNRPLRGDIRRFSEKGGIVYAECGGLMYLMSSIITLENEEYEMCSVFEGVSIMMRKPVGHGYVVGELVKDSIIAKRGTVLRGHEFHHSKTILTDKEAQLCIYLLRGRGLANRLDGIQKRRTYAQYMHIHPETYDFIGKLAKLASSLRAT